MSRAAWLACLALLGWASMACAADCTGFAIAKAQATSSMASICTSTGDAASSPACSVLKACTNGTVAASACDTAKLLASLCIEHPSNAACSG